MARRLRARDLWLPILGAVVLGAIAAELVQDIGAAAPPAPLPPTTLGSWPGRPLRDVQAVGAGPLPAGLLPAATGMMAALEGWRSATFEQDVVVSVVAHDPLGRWGYYDASAHQLRIVGDSAGVIGAMTVVHELTHALQDQHLDLGARAVPPLGTDANLAWRALVEGEAMLAGAELTGVPLDAHGELPQLRALDDGAAESLFVYMDGAAFVSAVRDARGWAGLTAAWQTPPRTTVEILDPSLYLDETPLLDPEALGEGERAGAYALWRLLGETPEGRAEGRAIARAWRGDARDEGGGTWTLAVAPPWDERLVALAPDALAASGLRDGTARLLAPGEIRLRWQAP
jgi:hypothetical protein